jgi:hypothetical protein
VTNKILPKSDKDSHVDRKIYGGSTLDLDVDGKPNNPKKFGTSDVYKNARDGEKKGKVFSEGLQYHLENKIAIDDNVYRPGTREFFNLINEVRSLWNDGKYAATAEEYELLQSDLGKWSLYEGKRVPLDFPMWDLNEAFADHYDDHFGSWIELSHDDISKHEEIYQEIYDIIDTSYKYIGGHANYKNALDIANDKDISIFKLIDVDDDPEVDAGRMYKQTKYGMKAIGSATDGSDVAKNALKDTVKKDFKKSGFYAEVSGKAAHVMIKSGAPIVNDEEIVRKVLSGKSITWYGTHPNGEFPGTDGWYSRDIGGEKHLKIMIGHPFVPMNEAKYKGREVKLGTAGASQSGGRAHVYVRDPKTGKVKKVSFGSGMPDAMGNSPKHKKRRKSFAARHKCSTNHDKMSAGYWACRATKMFGRKVPGWW